MPYISSNSGETFHSLAYYFTQSSLKWLANFFSLKHSVALASKSYKLLIFPFLIISLYLVWWLIIFYWTIKISSVICPQPSCPLSCNLYQDNVIYSIPLASMAPYILMNTKPVPVTHASLLGSKTFINCLLHISI